MLPARMAGAAFTALVTWIPATGAAQSPPALDEVVVTATRHETSTFELPASVSVVDADAVELRAPARRGDLLRHVPHVYARGVTRAGRFPGSAHAALPITR